jgi:hypothetical protein
LDYSPNITNLKASSSVIINSGTFAQFSIATTGTTSSKSKIIITLTPSNPIPSSGQIAIIFPTAWINDNSGSQIINDTVTCSPIKTVIASINCFIKDSRTIIVNNLLSSSIST